MFWYCFDTRLEHRRDTAGTPGTRQPPPGQYKATTRTPKYHRDMRAPPPQHLRDTNEAQPGHQRDPRDTTYTAPTTVTPQTPLDTTKTPEHDHPDTSRTSSVTPPGHQVYPIIVSSTNMEAKQEGEIVVQRVIQVFQEGDISSVPSAKGPPGRKRAFGRPTLPLHHSPPTRPARNAALR